MFRHAHVRFGCSGGPRMGAAVSQSRFHVGQLVEWWYEQRGGYGFGHWVPAVVVSDPGTANPERRVRIEAQRTDGSWHRRSVCARRLRDAEFGQEVRS